MPQIVTIILLIYIKVNYFGLQKYCIFIYLMPKRQTLSPARKYYFQIFISHVLKNDGSLTKYTRKTNHFPSLD